MINVSAPGKIHLIGEHSVVYGKTAILASINLYLHAKISKSPTKQILGLPLFDDAISNMQKAIEKKIIEKFNLKEIPGYKIEIDKSEIPVGSGLGTSASLSVCFTVCLLKLLDLEHTKDDIFEIAFAGETVFHGNPSGGDLAAVLETGIILFRKSNDKFKVKNLNFEIPKNLNKFLLINSGKPEETTSDMVKFVSQKQNTVDGELTKFLQSQGALSTRLVKILKKGEEDKFIQLIKKSEKNLEKLGVVSEYAKKIVVDIEHLGGCAKISGAGGIKKGSGMILAYHKDLNTLIKFAKDNELKYYPVEISYEGIKY